MELSKTFNVEQELEGILDKFLSLPSGKQYYYEFRLELAKELIKKYKIHEVVYTLPKTKFKINGKSHGIDACDCCKRQTNQTARKSGWTCDKCGNDTN